MKNIILIVSGNKANINHHLTKIKKKLDVIEVIQYDLIEDSISKVIEDLDTINFLFPKKFIVAENAVFFSSNKVKTAPEHNLKKLEDYIKNPNPDNYLILTCDNLDKENKKTKDILSNIEIINEEINIHTLIKEIIDDYKIDNLTINYLINYCNFNNDIIISELEKLKLYKLKEKEITIDDINLVVHNYLDNDIFKLVDYIVKEKKEEALELYNSLIVNGEQVTNIITKVANKIRLIYQVKVFLNDGKSDQEIAKLLSVHPYPVKLAREVSYSYSEVVLLDYLEKLAMLDYDIKSGAKDSNISFELWLLSF